MASEAQQSLIKLCALCFVQATILKGSKRLVTVDMFPSEDAGLDGIRGTAIPRVPHHDDGKVHVVDGGTMASRQRDVAPGTLRVEPLHVMPRQPPPARLVSLNMKVLPWADENRPAVRLQVSYTVFATLHFLSNVCLHTCAVVHSLATKSDALGH